MGAKGMSAMRKTPIYLLLLSVALLAAAGCENKTGDTPASPTLAVGSATAGASNKPAVGAADTNSRMQSDEAAAAARVAKKRGVAGGATNP